MGSALVHEMDQERRTCLHYATCYGHQEAAALLLGAGADPLARDSVGFTALHFAARWDHPELVAYLLTLTHLGLDVNARDRWGQTPLHVASLAGHTGVVSVLLRDGGVDVGALDEEGHTALEVARDAATLAKLNDTLQGRPSVATLVRASSRRRRRRKDRKSTV